MVYTDLVGSTHQLVQIWLRPPRFPVLSKYRSRPGQPSRTFKTCTAARAIIPNASPDLAAQIRSQRRAPGHRLVAVGRALMDERDKLGRFQSDAIVRDDDNEVKNIHHLAGEKGRPERLEPSQPGARRVHGRDEKTPANFCLGGRLAGVPVWGHVHA
jgi:hypothetical protein